jgi:hypothetical protein
MIDRPKRDRLAEALRHLLSGRIDNLAFDELDCPGDITVSDDRAIFEAFSSVWPCYDDSRSHPLQLTDGQRLDVKRFILFLHSDSEYEWPRKGFGIVEYLRRVISRIAGYRFGWWPVKSDGDMAVWPFFRPDDYDRALQSPRLLRGEVKQGGDRR